MYEELVERLRTCGNSLSCNKCKWRPECDGISDSFRKAADAIEELQEDSVPIDDMEMILSEVAKPHWIPVTERLPEAWEEVMLQFPNNQAAGFFDGDCGWGVFSGDDFYTYVAPEEVHPTHWAKKLPDPPKEE